MEGEVSDLQNEEEEQKSKRLVLFMHGTRTYLPNKTKFLCNLSWNLKADVIAFNYRGFGQSDCNEPDEIGI